MNVADLRVPGLDDKRVLVTGAYSGIGRAMAQRFAANGARVGVHYASGRAAAEQLVAEIRSAGGRAEALEADLMTPAGRAGLVPEFVARFGGLDVLVNNAGRLPRHDFLEIDDAALANVLSINLVAPFFLAQRAFAHMREHGGGRIINVSSVTIKWGGAPNTTHYSITKGGLEVLTVALAQLGAPHHILVNTLRPGFTDSPMNAAMPAAAFEARVARLPLKRAVRPDEVAQIALYLASSAADAITGQTFSVTAGD